MNAVAPRPLHVEPRRHARVLLDGPALRIEMPGGAPRFVPLRRVSRVIASARVELSTEAILACADAGILICLHDRHGQTLARILGRAGERTALRQRLHDIADRPDAGDRYDDWRRSQERRVCGIVRHRLQGPWSLVRDAARLAAWTQNQAIRHAGPRDADHSRRIFRQYALAAAQAELLARGVGAEDELWLTGDRDLARDLGTLLALRIETLRLGWLRGRAIEARRLGRPLPPLSRRVTISRLEHDRARIERLTADLVNRLHRWLVEIA